FASSVSGLLDEVRVSATNRTATWVATEYANQSAPGTFSAAGTEESPGTPTMTVTSSPAGRILTVDGATCTAPCSYQWASGTTHTIAAATQSRATGTQF